MNIGTYEAKTRFTQMLKRVEQGDDVVITRHDRPVARLVAHAPPAARPAREVIAELKTFRKGRLLRRGGLKGLIDEGRL